MPNSAITQQVQGLATTTSPGLVGTDSQTFAGIKTFQDGLVPATSMMFRNRIINGNFAISQRGSTITSISSDGTYTADRWYVVRGGNLDYAQRAFGSYNPPTGFQYYGEFVNKTASNPVINVTQPIETANCYDLKGKTITISFYARAHANTTASKSLNVYLGYNTAVDSKLNAVILLGTASLNYGTGATDWKYFSYTVVVPSIANSLSPSFDMAGTLAVNDGFHITGVQLEAGPAATPFEYRINELTLCQRYYNKSYSLSVAPGSVSQPGAYMQPYATSGNTLRGTIFFKQSMRAAPVVTVYNPETGTSGYWGNEGSGATNQAAAGITFISENNALVYSTSAPIAGTYYFQWVAEKEI